MGKEVDFSQFPIGYTPNKVWKYGESEGLKRADMLAVIEDLRLRVAKPPLTRWTRNGGKLESEESFAERKSDFIRINRRLLELAEGQLVHYTE